MRIIYLFLFAILLAFEARAVQEPIPISTDFRIREIPYNKNDVFKFTGHFGYQSSIEFEDDETIRTVSIGDSIAWQIVPSGNRLFLKPVEDNPDTNMTVVTDKRVYHFELHGKETDNMRTKDMVFVVRFIYPGNTDVRVFDSNRVPTAEQISETPNSFNLNYSIAGPERIAPIRIFDDGEFTYFQFRDINADVPAFFKVDSEGKEAIINFRTVGDYVVVERVASAFTLRHGADIVCVFNEAQPLQLLPGAREDDE